MASEKMIVNVDKLEGNSKKVRLDNRENDEAVAGAKSSQEAESDNLQSSGKDGGAFEQINNNKGNRQVKNNRNRQVKNVAIVTSVKLKLKNAEDIIHSIEKKQGKSKLSRKPGRPKKVKPTEGFETLKLKSKLLSRKPGRPKKVKPTDGGFETLKHKTMKRKRSKLSIAQEPRGSKELNLTAWNTLLKMAIKKLKNMKQASNVKRIGGVVRRSQPTLKDISDDVVEKKLDDAAKRGVIDRIEKQGKVTYRIAIRNSDPEVLDQVKKTKVRRHNDDIAAKIPCAVRRLQDWNNKGRMENRNPNIQAEGDEHLLVGSLRRPDNPEQNTQTPPYNSNSVEDQPLTEYGSPGTSETTPNIGQRSPDVNNGNPEQSLARPARNLLEKAVESHPHATQPPGTCKSPGNCQLQRRQHGVNFSHLARHGITVTPVRNRNSASNGSGSEEVAGGIHRFQRGSEEVAGGIHRFQRNQPVIHRDDRASIGQQRNLSVKVVGGDMKVINGGVTVEMKCTELEIDGPPDDVLKLVTKFKPSFGALQ